MTPTFSIIVATTGRDTLARALQSVKDQAAPGDELILVGEGAVLEDVAASWGARFVPCARGGDQGYTERNTAMPHATGDYLLFLDDDDAFTPGAFASIRAAARTSPGRPLMFKMITPWGRVLWSQPVVRQGNHGGPQFVVPNDPARLGRWGTRYEGDFDFCQSTLALYPEGALVWDATVIYACRQYASRVQAPRKWMIVHPGATLAIADVEAGLRFGLEAHGVQTVRYRLDERIDRSKRWLFGSWRRAKKTNPALEKPNTADVFYQAGIGALEMALRHQVDVVIVVSAMFLHPDVLILMKRAGLRVVVLFTESPYDLQQELKVAALVDGCWTNERTSVEAFRAVNPNSGYLPHAWHPARHLPGLQPGDEGIPSHDVVFVGSAFHERVTWLQGVDWTGIDLGLYGNWDALGSRHPLRRYVRGLQVDNQTTAALYRHAKVGLNLYRTSQGWGKDAPAIAYAESLNPRAYELAACGAFHLSSVRAEVGEVFGDLVPTFETPAEASALLRTWLADDAGRARVQAHLPACVAESSWVHRSAQVIGDVQTLLQRRAA